MGLPKNYRKDLKITPHKQGFAQRQSILDDIANDGRVNADNAHTIVGYKGFYRTITCVPTDLDEFDGR